MSKGMGRMVNIMADGGDAGGAASGGDTSSGGDASREGAASGEVSPIETSSDERITDEAGVSVSAAQTDAMSAPAPSAGKIAIIPAIGEALNFGGRRLETIARVAFAPVVALLILNMVTLFGVLSLAVGRVITFADANSFQLILKYANDAAPTAWRDHTEAMLLISGASMALQLVLIASFMAPLIRLAGLGERPAPGVARIPFGADQLRFIGGFLASFPAVGAALLAPLAIVVFYVGNYINEALSKTYASFPDENSLHTIDLVKGNVVLAERGLLWIYNLAVPLMAAAPVALLFWFLLFRHFAPKNQVVPSGRSNPVARAIVTLILAAGGIWLFGGLMGQSVGGIGLGVLIAAFALIFYYATLRMAPYAGVAVCRKSMALKPVFTVTRGGNLIRVLVVLIVVSVLMGVVQYLINKFALPWIGVTVNAGFVTLSSYTKLTGGGEAAAWVYPTFMWAWNIIKILVNLLWTFFSYGVLAGLMGRFYRESGA